ncbi:MAG TPA: hypothetical protein VK524_18690 [Polyangiaceae bacterium]|nr:hypothetical protein [Polyangiaceae bacterium]
MNRASFTCAVLLLIEATLACSSSSRHSVNSQNGDAGACESGDKRCAGNVPQTCAGGEWQSSGACVDPTPVCSAGTCAPFRLQGSIGSLGVRVPSGAVRLKHEALELTARLCNPSICVTGGITR